MSTQTDWLELTNAEMSIEVKAIEAEGEPDKCHICNATPWVSRACESFEVRACQKCDLPICQDHIVTGAEVDSDQDGFFVSSWICKDGCEEVK